MEIDLTNHIVPTIIPYHLLSFWTGMWNPPPLHNLNAFEKLLELSLGLEIDYSDLTIELFAITRKRILQQSSTNVVTFDLEDGQYLYVTRADRDYTVYQVESNADVAPDILRAITYREWNTNSDTRTRIAQIPPNMAWTHRFTWPKLSNNYLWRMPSQIKPTSNDAYIVLMPGAQGQSKVAYTGVTRQYPIMTDLGYTSAHHEFVGGATQPSVSYPMINLSHPWIPDESGYMKLRYTIRMSAETHVRLHLYPDYQSYTPPLATGDTWLPESPAFWLRQTLELPILTTQNPKMKTVAVPCIPFEIST
jgi:hypothetical protein